MKTSMLSKIILGISFVFVSSITLSAASPKNYLYDTKEENGKIVEKTVFLEQNGLLNQQVRYEFVYNEQGKVGEKQAFRWNKNNGNWEPFYLITYAYDTESNHIHSVYKMWNKKTNDYSLNVQEMTTEVEAYDEIFS